MTTKFLRLLQTILQIVSLRIKSLLEVAHNMIDFYVPFKNGRSLVYTNKSFISCSETNF